MAIIGILSIGGLTTYRRAMEKYHVNRFVQFVENVYFASKELCLYTDECILGSSANYLPNRNLICNSIGNPDDFCRSTDGVWTNLTPFGNNSKWLLYTSVNTPRIVYFQFLNLPTAACQSLVLDQLHLHGISTSTTTYHFKNGKISDAQKKDILDACKINGKIALQWSE